MKRCIRCLAGNDRSARRLFLKSMTVGTASLALPGGWALGAEPREHQLLKLPYAYDALEPSIDARTMEIHHSKHHQAYINNLNSALEKHPRLAAMPVEKLIASLEDVPADIRTQVRNNGGGHANHLLFWEVMGPGKGGEPRGELAAAIRAAFSDFANFKEKFSQAAMGRFGSGWAWLSVDGDGRLGLESSANQDSPLMEGRTPLLGLDVWEHAYYLRYQNRRAEYVAAWWKVVNWDNVARRYAGAAS